MEGEIYDINSEEYQIKDLTDVSVNIRDEDINYDEYLGSSPYQTDENGNYNSDFIDSNHDLPPDEEAEVYLLIMLEGLHVKVKDTNNANLQEYKYFGHLAGSKELDWNISEYNKQTNIYYYITKAYNYFLGSPFYFTDLNEYKINATIVDKLIGKAGEDILGRFMVSSSGKHILIKRDYANYNEVMMHEYIHYVIYQIYPSHQIGPPCTEGKAMDEAFSNYYAASIDNDAYLDSIKLYLVSNKNYSTYNKICGHEDTNSDILSTALWDLRGYTNKTYTDELIFRALDAYNYPNTFRSFYDALNQADIDFFGGKQHPNICNSFLNSGMNFCIPDLDMQVLPIRIKGIATDQTSVAGKLYSIITNAFKVVANWKYSDKLDIILVDPTGKQYTSTTSDPNFKFIARGTMEFYNLTDAQKNGNWTIKVNGTSVNGYIPFDLYIDPIQSKQPPKGVNFSNINLNFLTHCSPTQDTGLSVVFKGDKYNDEGEIVNITTTTQNATNAFLAGLVIPNQNQIVSLPLNAVDADDTFAQTDAAQTMFAADVNLKLDTFGEMETFFQYMTGYWKLLVNSSQYYDTPAGFKDTNFNQFPIYNARVWIEPDYVTVNGSGCDMYVEDARMEVF